MSVQLKTNKQMYKVITKRKKGRIMNIYLAGDSIVQNYTEEEFIAGWGQYLKYYVTPDTKVFNCAKGGRSSRLFLNEGRFDKIDESIQAPGGLVYAGNTELPYYFAWGSVSDVDSYNVYVDGVYATNVSASSVNLDKAVFTKGSGEYTIGVASVKNNKISSITSIKYTYAESRSEEHTSELQSQR